MTWWGGTRAFARCSRSVSGCRGRRSCRRPRRGFELATELPLRAQLYALGENAAGESEHVLLLLLHHIAGDGWSLSPLWRDLAGFYAARPPGRAAQLASL